MRRSPSPKSALKAPSFLALAAALTTSISVPAGAAVRLCEGQVSSGLKTAATEIEAKRLALQAWIAAAREIGEGYTSWRLAVGKLLSCSKAEDGAYQCLAKAEPCVIRQKPPPPGSIHERTAPGLDG